MYDVVYIVKYINSDIFLKTGHFCAFSPQFFDTNGQLSTRLYYNNFVIIYVLHIDSNILTDPGYEVYISQRIRYVRTCSLYSDF